MKAIVGRLADLGLRELLKLLTSAGAEGHLDLEAPSGRSRLQIRKGHVIGEVTPTLVVATATRSGTFSFQPGTTEGGDWVPQELFLAHLEARAGSGEVAMGAISADSGRRRGVPEDPISELRDSLAEVALPSESVRVLVLTADPRWYRTLAPEWRQRGWMVTVEDNAKWPEGVDPNVLIIHVPVSGTVAGQGEGWLAALRVATIREPRVPVLWVGGLSDSWLRHNVIMGGADFLIPNPAAEIGETARWFREELGVLVDRVLARHGLEMRGEAEAFREFFVALHADASAAETCASLLRLASNYFGRGALFVVTEECFESLGGYGFDLGSGTGTRVSRGAAPFEDVVVERHPVQIESYIQKDAAALARALKLKRFSVGAEVFPLLAGGDCKAVFLGDSCLVEPGATRGLASLLARSGTMIAIS